MIPFLETRHAEDYTQGNAVDYRGLKSTTGNGSACHNWSSRISYGYEVNAKLFPEGGLGDHNNCRNPNGEDMAWCYTSAPMLGMDWGGEWDYCDIGNPSPKGNCRIYSLGRFNIRDLWENKVLPTYNLKKILYFVNHGLLIFHSVGLPLPSIPCKTQPFLL